MAAYVQESLKHCSKCKKTTLHRRNNSKSSGFMILVHLILAVVTAGLWLLPVLAWKLLCVRIGGWKCANH